MMAPTSAPPMRIDLWIPRPEPLLDSVLTCVFVCEIDASDFMENVITFTAVNIVAIASNPFVIAERYVNFVFLHLLILFI